MNPQWRVGTKLGRTLYRDEQCVGMVDTPELAAGIVAAMNKALPAASGMMKDEELLSLLESWKAHDTEYGEGPLTAIVAIIEQLMIERNNAHADCREMRLALDVASPYGSQLLNDAASVEASVAEYNELAHKYAIANDRCAELESEVKRLSASKDEFDRLSKHLDKLRADCQRGENQCIAAQDAEISLLRNALKYYAADATYDGHAAGYEWAADIENDRGAKAKAALKAAEKAGQMALLASTTQSILDKAGMTLAEAGPKPREKISWRRCSACGDMTRDTTAGCDHCDLEDK
jgi:hypothetical protein